MKNELGPTAFNKVLFTIESLLRDLWFGQRRQKHGGQNGDDDQQLDQVKPRCRYSGSAIIFIFQLESFADAPHVRFQIQQHKIIWPRKLRGV